MGSLKVAWFIFVWIIVVCPINEVLSHAFIKAAGSHDAPYGDTGYVKGLSPPCEICPRHGQCVPKVSCPAHLKPGSGNPECHLEGSGQVGVCCFSGGNQESDWMPRQRKSMDIEQYVKIAHNFSHVKVEEMFRRTEKLLEHSRNTVVNAGTPDFGQHLSFISSDEQEAELGRGGLLNLFVTQELKNRHAIDDHELLLGSTEHTDGFYCPSPPSCREPPSRYSNLNGECNNAEHPSWGAANTGFERLLPPDYDDGIWSIRTSITGLPLPSPRTISSAMIPDMCFPSPTHNMIFMQFSQFIAHDVSAAVMFSIGNNSAISCCTAEGGPLPPEQLHFACAPIAVDPEDEFFGLFGRTCLNFVRAQLAPSSDCTVGYPKAMNGATHFLDLSQLYGKTPEKLELLRSEGYMKTFNDYGRELPPLTDRKECMSAKEHGACFESGDNHGNQIISLTALHLIFTREHNRIARALTRLNAFWDEDKVFYETRRLLQAMFQHIVYNEWLPLLLGPDTMAAFDLFPSPGYSTSYDPSINPSLLAEFSAAAMRFGHSTVDGTIKVTCPKTGELYEAISIPEVMFEPTRMRLRNFLDRMLYGLSCQPMQSVDPFVTVALTRYLFRGGSPFGLDLASLNIQRGRDYGLRSYNHYRRLCGLQPFVDFNQFPPSASKRLSYIYDSPEDIDLWIGGLLEEHVEGGIVGPTFAHIIAEQFSRLKKGDRYHYAHGPDVNPGAFNSSQLEEIKKITLARIICDNKDGIELTLMSPNAFLRADLPENSPLPCDSSVIPSMDLSRFKEFKHF